MSKTQSILAYLIGAAVLCTLCAQVRLWHYRARDKGYQAAARHYEAVIAYRVEKAIAGTRRVQAVREQNEYDRGRRSCTEN